MKLSEQEKLILRLQLTDFMSRWIEDNQNENIGYVPDNISMLMADAAFGIIDTVNSVNHYFETQQHS